MVQFCAARRMDHPRGVHLLAKLSMRNRALVALVTVVIALFGVVSMRALQQELAPSISFPQIAVVTSYPGAAPEVVSTDVSAPVEAAIQGVPGLERRHGDVEHEHLRRDSEVHVRHRPGHGRAEDDPGHQPDQERAAQRPGPAGRQRLVRRPAGAAGRGDDQDRGPRTWPARCARRCCPS